MKVDTPEHEFGLDSVMAALFASKGITSGLWRLAAKLRFAGITAGFPDQSGVVLNMPTGMIGIEGLALVKALEPGPLVFDAAVPPAMPVAPGAKAAGRQTGGKKRAAAASKQGRGV